MIQSNKGGKEINKCKNKKSLLNLFLIKWGILIKYIVSNRLKKTIPVLSFMKTETLDTPKKTSKS